MTRVTHFDMTADDVERAIGFYANVFGWKFDKWAGPMEYWLISTGSEEQVGINGGLSHREDPDPGTVLTIDVDSVDDFAAKIEAEGGKIIRPKGAIPGVGWFAYCQDTEGNFFGLMEEDTSAQ
ncbi:MAG: VOC family protein [Candidatus Promineifilaceae bacterium]|nr:VOC family protein [Candidatus Promineifilaceae bacterium]